MCVLLPVATLGACTIRGTTMESHWLRLCWDSSLVSEGAWRSWVQRSSEPSPNPKAIQSPKTQSLPETRTNRDPSQESAENSSCGKAARETYEYYGTLEIEGD